MLTDLLFGVAFPLYIASIYQTVIGFSITFTVIGSIVFVISLIVYLVNEDWQDEPYFKIFKNRKFIIVYILFACNFAFSVLTPNEKFMQYSMYALATYNTTTILADTPLGKKTINVVSNGTSTAVDATGKVFNATVSNTLGISNLLNAWIDKKTKDIQKEILNDIKPSDNSKTIITTVETK